MSGDFNPEQKRYLEGFVAGLQIAKAARANDGALSAQGTATAEPTGPDAPHLRAQDRVLKGGGKLSEQEKFKRELHPFDVADHGDVHRGSVPSRSRRHPSLHTNRHGIGTNRCAFGRYRRPRGRREATPP